MVGASVLRQGLLRDDRKGALQDMGVIQSEAAPRNVEGVDDIGPIFAKKAGIRCGEGGLPITEFILST